MIHTYSVSEACNLIGCDSPDWLVSRVRSGKFPGRKISRAIRFTDQDLQDILNLCAYPAETSKGIPDEIMALRSGV